MTCTPQYCWDWVKGSRLPHLMGRHQQLACEQLLLLLLLLLAGLLLLLLQIVTVTRC